MCRLVYCIFAIFKIPVAVNFSESVEEYTQFISTVYSLVLLVGSMREIAVIGAGAAGLVASRHLVACGLRPTIFEVGQGVGGAWASTNLLDHGQFSSLEDPKEESTSSSSSRPFLSSRHHKNNNRKRTAQQQLQRGKMWDSMTTNLSKYTCQFSDHPWPEQTAMFPSASDMSQYLQEYSDRFLDPQWFRYGCYVTNISQTTTKRDPSRFCLICLVLPSS